ncbi:MAG: glycosyltransferase [Clostridia bacterium]
MRILVTGFTANYGGVETFLMNYYRAMQKLDRSIVIDIISTAKEPAFKDEIQKMGGNVYRTSRARYKNRIRKELNKIMQENNYDVFWCNKCDLADITYLKESYKNNIPKRILHSHSSSNMFTGIRRKIVNVLHKINKQVVEKYATEFWSCSDYAADWLFTKNIAQNRTTFIPNSIDAEKFQYKEDIRNKYRQELKIEDKLVVGSVGAFLYAKNPEFTLEIFKEIHKNNSESVLLWVGSGELKEITEQKVKEYNMEKNVIFLGRRLDVDRLMQAMDCLLLPSRFEGLPVVAIEAQSAGLHVFASSEGISKQTKITDFFHFLSLQQSQKQWSEKILSTNLEHKDTYEQIKKAEFDINISAKSILNKLSEGQV